MADLQDFLDPAAREPEDLDGGPGPERVIVFEAQVAALAGGRVVGPGLAGGLGNRARYASPYTEWNMTTRTIRPLWCPACASSAVLLNQLAARPAIRA
jgi:hypothetical protein